VECLHRSQNITYQQKNVNGNAGRPEASIDGSLLDKFIAL
jgi:hypothetical protein